MRASSLGLIAIAFCGLTTSLHATTLLSENFDELTAILSATSAGAFSTINGTNVDIVGPGDGFGALCASPESGNCIDMDGSYGTPQGQLQSNMLFNAGTYLLSFDLIGNERGGTSATTVTFGNYNQTFSLAVTDTTSGIVLGQLVTLTSPGYLLFVSDDPAGDNVGNLLDNVTVSTPASVTTTPEPSSIVLLGTGLLSLAAAVRRRFASDLNS